MALTDAERQDVLSAIGTVLTRDIHDELMEFYAVAVALTERHPEQVNNEIRNAVTHLSRALEQTTRADADDDVRKAQSHIDRAKRDVLKIIVLELHDRIQVACAETKVFQGGVPPKFLLRRNSLTAQRRNVLIKEIKGEPKTLDAFVELYLEADDLHTEMLQTLNLTSRRSNRFILWFASLTQGLSGIAWACLAGVLVYLFCAFMWPDAVSLGNAMRRMVGMPTVEAGPIPTTSMIAKPAGEKSSGHH